MSLTQKYGPFALVAGASEGIGAAFSRHLAAAGMNLILVARRMEPMEALAAELRAKFKVEVRCIACDLARPAAAEELISALEGKAIDLLVYNAAIPYIGPFERNTIAHHQQIAQANMATPLHLIQVLGAGMLERGRGAVIMMASLAGFQGSGFISTYAASKAFDRVLAESLWYEWKGRGVDVIAVCAGATATPNYINTKPVAASFFAPKVQSPEAVVAEAFKHLGKRPSFVTGSGNKFATFVMQRLMPRKLAITIMGDTTRKMYGKQTALEAPKAKDVS